LLYHRTLNRVLVRCFICNYLYDAEMRAVGKISKTLSYISRSFLGTLEARNDRFFFSLVSLHLTLNEKTCLWFRIEFAFQDHGEYRPTHTSCSSCEYSKNGLRRNRIRLDKIFRFRRVFGPSGIMSTIRFVTGRDNTICIIDRFSVVFVPVPFWARFIV
jgi:hypothetical protein